MGKSVSLNIDLGELPDEPEALYTLATMVNLACGGHAGDRASMQRALGLAKQAGARIAAHPSYPDRAGFGRKSLAIAANALEASIHEQVATLVEIADEMGVHIEAVKPHGALYHDAATSPEIAEALLRAVDPALGKPVAIVGPPAGVLFDLAKKESRIYLREGFADRSYLPDGKLAPRSQPNALITNAAEAAAQAIRLARTNQFDTLCVHGDTPGAVEIARAVNQALREAGLLERRT